MWAPQISELATEALGRPATASGNRPTSGGWAPKWSLADLVLRCLPGYVLHKPSHLRTGNWDKRPLHPDQLYVPCLVHRRSGVLVFLHKRSSVKKTPLSFSTQRTPWEEAPPKRSSRLPPLLPPLSVLRPTTPPFLTPLPLYPTS